MGVIIALCLGISLTACGSNNSSTSAEKPSQVDKKDTTTVIEAFTKKSPNAYLPLIKIFAQAEKIPPLEENKNEHSSSIRFNKDFKAEGAGDFGAIVSLVAPATCYTDYVNKISMLLAFDEGLIISLTPEINCQGNLDAIPEIRLVSEDGKAISKNKEPIPDSLKKLYATTVKEFITVLNAKQT